MDGVSADIVARSVDSLNQVMKTAQAEMLELAEKMVAATVEIALGAEAGKGELLDIIA